MTRTEIRNQIEDLENQTPRTRQEFDEREDEINLLLDQLMNPAPIVAARGG